MNKQTTILRNDYIDFLKGLLIFLVIYGHSIQFIIYGNDRGFYENPAFKLIYIFHMPLFMAISGFVSSHSINNRKLLESITVRFNQLIVPIVFWAILHNLLLFYFNSYRLNLMFLKFVVSEVNSLFWFLWSLFLSYCIMALLKVVKMDNYTAVLLLSALILFIPDMHNSYMFKYTFPFFCFGYLISKSNSVVFPLRPNTFVVVICLIISLICFVIWNTDSYIYISKMKLTNENLFNIVFRYMSGAIVSITFLLLTSTLYRIRKFKAISKLGQFTLAIYILQTYLFTFIKGTLPVSDHSILLSIVVAPFLAALLIGYLYFVVAWISQNKFMGSLFFGTVKAQVRSG